MATVAKHGSMNINVASVSKNKEQVQVSEFWKNMEEARFAITPIILIVMACIGGFAAAVAMQYSWVLLAAIAFPATFALGTILAVMPMRTIIISSIIAVVIDVLIFAAFLLF